MVEDRVVYSLWIFFCTLLVVWLPVFCSTVGGWECFCAWVGVQVPGRL